MTKNGTKVESNAINIIREVVDKNPRLLPDPSFGDRGISTDGYIQLFKNRNVDKGENLLRLIPIQIKGRTDKTKNLVRLNASKIKVNVEIKDIRNYYRQGGAIFFFVYFNKNFERHTVYYSVFMPVKCKRYLDIASQNIVKTVPVTFEKMEETGEKIFELCVQFYVEQNKQGFGNGTLMEHIVSWRDINGKTTLTASAVGAKNQLDLLKRVVRGDIHLYAKDGSFTVPVEWLEDSRILKVIHYEHPVMINDNKFFDFVDVEIDVETKVQRLLFENTIIIDIGTSKFTFIKDNKSFYELAKASRFLLELSKYKEFSAGGISLIVSSLNLNDNSVREFLIHIEINQILADIGLNSKEIINNERNNNFRKQLFLLWEIANHKKDPFFNDMFTFFDWSFGDKKYPLVIVKNNDNRKNNIYGFLCTEKYQTFCESDKGEHFPVPTFSFPSYEVMKNLYLYDIAAFEEQIKRVPINSTTLDYINIGALKLLSIYDVSGDTKLLQMVKKLLTSLAMFDDSSDIVTINKIQVMKRLNSIGSNEIKTLKDYSNCGNTVFEFAAEVLLDEKEKAIQKYQELNKNELIELEETPIMTLYQKL